MPEPVLALQLSEVAFWAVLLAAALAATRQAGGGSCQPPVAPL